MTATVRVEGLARLQATLVAAGRRILNMTDPNRRTAAYVATSGRGNAPHLTGRLAASLRPSATADTAEVTSGLPYANRTHWGYARYGQRAQPFLSDAVTTGEVVIVNTYADEVDDVVGGIRGK